MIDQSKGYKTNHHNLHLIWRIRKVNLENEITKVLFAIFNHRTICKIFLRQNPFSKHKSNKPFSTKSSKIKSMNTTFQ